MDDKTYVIIAVTLIALIYMWKPIEDVTLLTSIVSGLFGVAVGKALK